MSRYKSRYWYLEVEVEQVGDKKITLNSAWVKVIFKNAVNTIFGEMTSSLPMNVLHYDPVTSCAIVRVVAEEYAKFRAGLSLCSMAVMGAESTPVTLSVRQASSCLPALAGPHRSLISTTS
ncbi:ribonuclease P protein subunit p14-like [Oratosquilla oratoria]|uniref:ribonuclease P protein subunit p14-like n=1 Tax=Oratosquilla oratoria TaxID=337810 RepID=UPI003F7604CB